MPRHFLQLRLQPHPCPSQPSTHVPAVKRRNVVACENTAAPPEARCGRGRVRACSPRLRIGIAS